MTGASALADEKVPFEDLLSRLEAIVGTLEEGDIALEDSLKAYEEGVGLVRQAQGRLDAMDARLEELLQNGQTEALELETFGADGDDDGRNS